MRVLQFSSLVYQLNLSNRNGKSSSDKCSSLDNPASFLNPFQFEITFECLENLSEGKNTMK